MKTEGSDPNIGVLVATYNGENWITSQIESIIQQKNVKTKIYINDDFSTDLTYERCLNLQKNNHNIFLNKQHFRLGSAAHNFFWLIKNIDLNIFDFIAFSDQDDEWFDEKLSHAVNELLKENCDGYSSNVYAFWANGRKEIINKAQEQKKYDYIFESAGPGCTFVLTRRLALEIQSFLITHNESCKLIDLHDWFIYAFARSRGYKWVIDKTPSMLYRQHANNVVGANRGIKAKLVRLKKLKQGWFIQQALIIAKLLGYSNQSPITQLTSLTIYNRLLLAINAGKMRRRLRDQLAFAFYILFIAKK